mmetsp:Transcript_38454/g.105940  ORF Transcript_38454/g.105940 Transcript_38454/m.105940 type:complete len:208 (+) Transcript_38454:1227-1850(+)
MAFTMSSWATPGNDMACARNRPALGAQFVLVTLQQKRPLTAKCALLQRRGHWRSPRNHGSRLSARSAWPKIWPAHLWSRWVLKTSLWRGSSMGAEGSLSHPAFRPRHGSDTEWRSRRTAQPLPRPVRNRQWLPPTIGSKRPSPVRLIGAAGRFFMQRARSSIGSENGTSCLRPPAPGTLRRQPLRPRTPNGMVRRRTWTTSSWVCHG